MGDPVSDVGYVLIFVSCVTILGLYLPWLVTCFRARSLSQPPVGAPSGHCSSGGTSINIACETKCDAVGDDASVAELADSSAPELVSGIDGNCAHSDRAKGERFVGESAQVFAQSERRADRVTPLGLSIGTHCLLGANGTLCAAAGNMMAYRVVVAEHFQGTVLEARGPVAIVTTILISISLLFLFGSHCFLFGANRMPSRQGRFAVVQCGAVGLTLAIILAKFSLSIVHYDSDCCACLG